VPVLNINYTAEEDALSRHGTFSDHLLTVTLFLEKADSNANKYPISG